MHMCGVCECVGDCEGFDVRESTTAFKEPPMSINSPWVSTKQKSFLVTFDPRAKVEL